MSGARATRLALGLLLVVLPAGASGPGASTAEPWPGDAAVDALAAELEAVPANAALRAEVARTAESLPEDPSSVLRALLAERGLAPVRIPGLFYRRYPDTGADLRTVERWLGQPVPLVETDETGTVEANAAVIARTLRAAPRPVVAISASKGTADLRAALEGEPALGAHVALWLDLVGVLEGTPLLELPEAAALALDLGLPAETRESLRATTRRRAATPETFPPTVRAAHVAAFPRRADVTPRALRAFRALSALGPNDGYVLLDAYRRAPGRVFVVRGADHYLRLETIERTLTALLAVLLREIPVRPDTRSTPWTSSER